MIAVYQPKLLVYWLLLSVYWLLLAFLLPSCMPLPLIFQAEPCLLRNCQHSTSIIRIALWFVPTFLWDLWYSCPFAWWYQHIFLLGFLFRWLIYWIAKAGNYFTSVPIQAVTCDLRVLCQAYWLSFDVLIQHLAKAFDLLATTTTHFLCEPSIIPFFIRRKQMPLLFFIAIAAESHLVVQFIIF